jgi:Ni/Fe-hydrogenase subunit HybB-like protein
MDLPHDALVNYIFPNNARVWWSILIVIYPYITGLIAGAFVVSALSHVFKIKEFKPIANFALIVAFCFGLFAALPLLLHLGQPQRALEIYFTPHLTSAMSIFGYIYTSYLILLMLEIWLIYRPHFILKANETTGIQKWIWYILTLGVTNYHPDSAKIDHKLAMFLAGIGIPWAFILHGYVGFVFGSVKAIAWWASPLQPVIFLLSAIVSGMAILIVMYTFIKWRSQAPYDFQMLKKFMAFLWGIFLLAFTLELLEVIFARYENGHHWSIIEPLINGPLFVSYVIIQVGLLSFIPAVLLGYVVLSRISDKTMLYLANLGASMLVLQVLFMRFNVVVGGQLISKSERGFVDYHWEFLGGEGVLAASLILMAPFVTYYVISRFLPIFEEPETSLDSHSQS